MNEPNLQEQINILLEEVSRLNNYVHQLQEENEALGEEVEHLTYRLGELE